MNELQTFSQKELGCIRAINIEGQPWFVAKDVAGVLGYENTTRDVNRHVDSEDKGSTEMVTPGGKQKLLIINESGLYSLILSSKLPKAKLFKRWVTAEVLPTIRQTGSYGYTTGNIDYLVSSVVSQTTAIIMKELPGVITNVVSGLLPLKPDDKPPEENQLQLTTLDWNEVAFWENLLSEWRDYRSGKNNKAQVDKQFLAEYNRKNPELKISTRTLYRKWQNFTEKGAMGLIDRRGRHGNHRRKAVTEITITHTEMDD